MNEGPKGIVVDSFVAQGQSCEGLFPVGVRIEQIESDGGEMLSFFVRGVPTPYTINRETWEKCVRNTVQV